VPDIRHSAKKPLPTGSLPSAALGKGFAECKWGFAECPGHSAKSLFPVVVAPQVLQVHVHGSILLQDQQSIAST
jgi:hypothetical protein